jgi:hypothetical protein
VTGLGAGDSRGRGGLLYDAIVFPSEHEAKTRGGSEEWETRFVRETTAGWSLDIPGGKRNGGSESLKEYLSGKSRKSCHTLDCENAVYGEDWRREWHQRGPE